jgi:hypothetical protein
MTGSGSYIQNSSEQNRSGYNGENNFGKISDLRKAQFGYNSQQNGYPILTTANRWVTNPYYSQQNG